jgi:cellulose biosynthesis protein BcsQ
MKKETLYVAFSTQKGGVGKTTFTVLVASYLYYLKGYNVAVVDCDYPQHSISAMRKRDAEQVTACLSPVQDAGKESVPGLMQFAGRSDKNGG